MMDQRGVAYRSASRRGNCGKIGLGSENKASFRLKIQIWAQAWARQIELIFGSGSGSGLPTCNSDQAWVEQYMARPSQVAPLLRSTSVDQVMILLYSMKSKERT